MTLPGQVTGLAVADKTPGNKLTWTAVTATPAVSSYKVYRSSDNVTYNLLATVGNVLVFYDTGVLTGQLWYYKVSAVNSDGEGTQSTQANRTMTKAAPRYELRSYTDFDQKGDTFDGGNWCFILDQNQGLKEDDSSPIDALPMSMLTAEDCNCMDSTGPSRKIVIEGKRKDGENTWIANATDGTDNAQWVKMLRRYTMGQCQVLKGPYRLVVITSPTTVVPNYTLADNYYVYVERFGYEQAVEDGTVLINWRLELVVGRSF